MIQVLQHRDNYKALLPIPNIYYQVSHVRSVECTPVTHTWQ